MLKDSALHSLKTLFPKGQVFTDRATLLSYEVDAGLDRGLPDGVVFPRSFTDVSRLMRWSAEYGVPLVARGAGTGLSGGAVADRGGIIVEFANMNHILDVDAYGRSATVEPGLINLRLDERVKPLGFYYPPDPASQRASTIGGNVAENSGGPHCFKYGVTTNYVIGMNVVLANGQAIRVGGRALDYPEYDLCGLITGSEGMLALMTSINLRMVRNPPAVKTMLAIFDSVEHAGNAVSAVIAAGLVPATMELMEQNIMRMVEPFAQAGLPLDAGAVLIIEVDGYAESLDAQTKEIVGILNECGVQGVRVANTEEERTKIWFARKSVAGAITRLSPAYYTVDVTVPRSKLAKTLVIVDQICKRHGIQLGHLLHAGDGNLHPMLLIPEPENAEFMHHVHEAGWEIVKTCLDMGGTLSGEHGVGIEKRNFMAIMHTPAELMAMWDVKLAFDPQNLLNPGKVFPVPSSEETGPFAGYDLANNGQYQTSSQQAPIIEGETFAPASAEEAAQGLLALSQAHRPVRIGDAHLSSADSSYMQLDTSKLSGIKEYAPDDLYITVGAGTPLEEIQDFLAKDGKQLALAPLLSPITIGGLISANINAPLRMRYGSIREHVLCATVALPDGRIIRTGRPLVKNVAGFDITKAFIGAYGTLGLITDITLKVTVQPRLQRTLHVRFDDLRTGLLLSRQLLPLALTASAIVLHRGFLAPLSPHGYVLSYTAEGLPQDVEVELAQVRQVVENFSLSEFIERDDPDFTGSKYWTDGLGIDYRAAELYEEYYGEPGPLQVRIALPPGSLPAYIQDHADLLAQSVFMVDVANGLILAYPDMRDETQEDVSAFALAWQEAVKAKAQKEGSPLTKRELEVDPQFVLEWLNALRADAQIAGGYLLVTYLPPTLEGMIDRRGKQPEGIEIMRALKARWDPNNVLNPGHFMLT